MHVARSIRHTKQQITPKLKHGNKLAISYCIPKIHIKYTMQTTKQPTNWRLNIGGGSDKCEEREWERERKKRVEMECGKYDEIKWLWRDIRVVCVKCSIHLSKYTHTQLTTSNLSASSKTEKRREFLTGNVKKCTHAKPSNAIWFQCIMEIGIVDVLCIHSIHYTNWKSGLNVSSVCLCLNMFIFPALSPTLSSHSPISQFFGLTQRLRKFIFRSVSMVTDKLNRKKGMEMVFEQGSKSEGFCIQRH